MPIIARSNGDCIGALLTLSVGSFLAFLCGKSGFCRASFTGINFARWKRICVRHHEKLEEIAMKMKLKKIKDQVIVITGASSGIGLTTARMAASRGARLVLAARNEEALSELCAEIEAK